MPTGKTIAFLGLSVLPVVVPSLLALDDGNANGATSEARGRRIYNLEVGGISLYAVGDEERVLVHNTSRADPQSVEELLTLNVQVADLKSARSLLEQALTAFEPERRQYASARAAL